MLSGVNQGRVGFYSTKSGSCPQLKVYSWAITILLFLLIGLLSCTLPGTFVPVVAKPLKFRRLSSFIFRHAGAPASEQAQLLVLLQFLQQAIQSSNWGLVSFYCNQILNRLGLALVAVSSVSGLLGN